jgi:hypothetical protein
MEDIGTKDDGAPAQPVFILSGVPKGMGVFTENSEGPFFRLFRAFRGLSFFLSVVASRDRTTRSTFSAHVLDEAYGVFHSLLCKESRLASTKGSAADWSNRKKAPARRGG